MRHGLRASAPAPPGRPAAASRAILAAAVFAMTLAAGIAPAAAADPSVLDLMSVTYENRPFLLKQDLHQPNPGGVSAPSVDAKGWHNHDPNRPVIMSAGERVQVTGVFNYGDRAVFLEISDPEKWRGGAARRRVRIRFTADTGPEKPDIQASQLQALIGRVLTPAP